MLRNYIAAAVRNVARNKLYAGINIIGLAVGFAAAILIILFVQDELSYDRYIKDYERVYRISPTFESQGTAPIISDASQPQLAAWLKLDFPQIEATARIVSQRRGIRRDNVETSELLYWADSTFFDVMEFPVVAGNLKSSLGTPDGIVLTRAMARKLFGRDNPIGESIEIDRKFPMRITAIIEDIPENTNMPAEIFASGSAAFSKLAELNNAPADNILVAVYTYFKLKPHVSIEQMTATMPTFIDRHWPANANKKMSSQLKFSLLSLSEIHLSPSGIFPLNARGEVSEIYSLSAVAILILIVASVNFVNLMTARATRRALEVGIRKVFGANRRDLVIQFLGESIIYIIFSVLLAGIFLLIVTPYLSAFLGHRINFSIDFLTGIYFLIGAIIIGILSGFYPAIILSSFRPAGVLRNKVVGSIGSKLVRQVLVVGQFSILIIMILATATVYRQTRFALEKGISLNKDGVVLIETSCKNVFKDEVLALRGVAAAACSASAPTNTQKHVANGILNNGAKILIDYSSVDFGFFELYDLQPLAGRFFAKNHISDAVTGFSPLKSPVILNETAIRKFGFMSPQAAIGQAIMLQVEKDSATSVVVGVVPDFLVDSVREPASPTVYYVAPDSFRLLNVKIRGGEISDTLKGIDQIWNRVGDNPRPVQRQFVDQYLIKLYQTIIQQTKLFAMFASVALFISCLGLFGLSVFTAERRTREIGIRKAIGAGIWDIVILLTWQFAKPVILANVVAWPVAYYLLNRWLDGFSYHTDLPFWIFLGSASLALIIALGTISMHALSVARDSPIGALRSE